MKVERKSIPVFALWGALGFGIGGTIAGATLIGENNPLGFAIMGATGGASLGLALDGWKRAVLLALVEATALFVGIYLSVFIGMALGLTLTKVFLEIFRLVYPFIMGAVIGAIGGVVIGLALKDWKRTGFLALAGAIGFGAVAQFNDAVFLGVFNSRILSVTVPLVVWGLVGGASLGTALGCLERRKGGEVNQTDRQ